MTGDYRGFRLYPRKPRQRVRDETKTWSIAFKRIMHYARMSRKQRGGAAKGASNRPRKRFKQRCAVRLTYSRNKTAGQWFAHGRYLMRESASGRSTAPTAFTTDNELADLSATLADWQKAGDERLFKLILSPELLTCMAEKQLPGYRRRSTTAFFDSTKFHWLYLLKTGVDRPLLVDVPHWSTRFPEDEWPDRVRTRSRPQKLVNTSLARSRCRTGSDNHGRDHVRHLIRWMESSPTDSHAVHTIRPRCPRRCAQQGARRVRFQDREFTATVRKGIVVA